MLTWVYCSKLYKKSHRCDWGKKFTVTVAILKIGTR